MEPNSGAYLYQPGAHYKVLVQSSLLAVGEWRTTVSGGEAISISMPTKREEGEPSNTKCSNTNAPPTPMRQIWPPAGTIWCITNGDGLMAVVGLWA